MQNDKLHIKLHIYDADLSVNCPREDEEYYRSAAKMVTEKLNTYFTYFKGKKSDREIIYMAMLDIALQQKQGEARNDTAPFTELLDRLTIEIEDMLEK